MSRIRIRIETLVLPVASRAMALRYAEALAKHVAAERPATSLRPAQSDLSAGVSRTTSDLRQAVKGSKPQ